MLSVEQITRIALRENDGQGELSNRSRNPAHTPAPRADPQIPSFSPTSRPLSVVRFRCLLQDTGYPAEVYLPDEAPAGEQVDWSKLRERWVGWAVEVPGEQPWAKLGADLTSQLASLGLEAPLPPPIKGKYPLNQDSYTGALLKVYDDVSFRPASAYDVVGIVSSAPVPTPYSGDDEDAEAPLAPAIHVLTTPVQAYPPAPGPTPVADSSVRARLVSYLASAFSPPDEAAGELLLLTLIASPASRPVGLAPLGTLSVNLLRQPVPSASLHAILASVSPTLIALKLTLELLHSRPFRPSSSDGTSLTPGLLQLAPGTVLALDESGLGEGGQLRELAVKNVQALGEAIGEQVVKYEYPFMDGLKMETAVRAVIESEGRSLLPADVHVPVTLAAGAAAASDAELAEFRAYLAYHGSSGQAARIVIPDEVGTAIQDGFVEERKAAGAGSVEAAQARLQRRMKLAR
ncbi:hypothetical protein VHUM_04107 [Vanrija humicola]|uniref:Mini-chromosome maintenance complex-binding protein n=1 Tax=Vanrija humicola TaxID=5417 RepID=A0A7D8UW23_VANHU|nr:hypothetical protein VHUM_04107 [Vanrija humicola]